jgi:hypothetical protein
MYTALRATSLTLSEYIRQRLNTDPSLALLFGGGSMVVSLNTPQEMIENQTQGLSIWLYRVVRDDERLNAPSQWVIPNQLRRTPLPIRLHYLITPITSKGPNTDPVTEQVILGKVLQTFYDHPTLHGTDLQNDFIGTTVELNVRLEPMGLEEVTRIWEALEGSYQLSVSYEVSVVYISSEKEPEDRAPVTVVIPNYAVIVSSEPS